MLFILISAKLNHCNGLIEIKFSLEMWILTSIKTTGFLSSFAGKCLKSKRNDSIPYTCWLFVCWKCRRVFLTRWNIPGKAYRPINVIRGFLDSIYPSEFECNNHYNQYFTAYFLILIFLIGMWYDWNWILCKVARYLYKITNIFIL